MSLIVEAFPVGPLQCNCVVLGDEETREAVIIDPGDEAERIEEILDHYRLDLKSVVHTHGHIDHILAAEHLRKTREAAVCLHEADRFLWDGIQMQASFLGLRVEAAGKVDRHVKEGDEVPFGDYKLRVLETPGHTPGSICLFLKGDASPILFSGDTLFQNGIGRTDLWGGSFEAITTSIRKRLYGLDEETLVQPGHGPATTIGEEKNSNPFVRYGGAS